VSLPDRQSPGPRDWADRYREPVDGPPSSPRRRSTLQPTTVISDNQRALSAFGATLVVLIFSIVGAVADVAVFGSLGWIFGVLFVLSCTASTLRSHVDDLLAVAIMPPLIYALITVGVGVLHPSASTGGGMKSDVINVGSELILRAPSLLVAEVLVILIAVIRGRRATVARRERARAAARRDIRAGR
jgi:hypothetical protein